jgi:hypothetical protein
MLAKSEIKNYFGAVTLLHWKRFFGYLTPYQSSELNYRANDWVKFKMNFDVDKNVGSIGDQKLFGEVTFVPLENGLLAI